MEFGSLLHSMGASTDYDAMMDHAKQGNARRNDMYSHLANASEAAPATASLPFRPRPVAVYSHVRRADQWVRLLAWGFLLVCYTLWLI